MKNLRKAIAICMIYFLSISILPINFLQQTANADTSVPKYLKYSDLYVQRVAQYSNKSLIYANNKMLLVTDNKLQKTVLNLNGNEEYLGQLDTKGKSAYFNTFNYYTGETKYYKFDFDSQKLSSQKSIENSYGDYSISSRSIYSEDSESIKYLKNEKILEKINTKYKTKYNTKDNYIYATITEIKVGSDKVKLFECNIQVGNKYKNYYGIYNNNINKITTSWITYDMSEDGKKVFYFEQDSKNNNYKVYTADNKSIKQVATSKDVWHSIKIRGDKLYTGWEKVSEYTFTNSKYKLVNSYKSVGYSYAIDINNNLWLLQESSGKKYVCKVKNGKAEKKYQVDTEMMILYVYNDNNIITGNHLKTTFITPKGTGALVQNVNVSSVKLNKTSLSIAKGEKETLKATVNPSNATNKNVTWASSNTKVATVDSKGNVTAVAPGNATITVKTKNGSKTATCKVTVLKTFGKFEVKSVSKSSTKITGTGTKGAKVTAYVDGKSIGSATVANDGKYSIKIAKQKSGKQITVKMTKSGYKTVSKTIKVK